MKLVVCLLNFKLTLLIAGDYTHLESEGNRVNVAQTGSTRMINPSITTVTQY